METNKIIQGDCLKVMKTFPDNSIDTILTDPPYGLSFMGKKWDYDVPKVELWQEALRVLKPGGTLLSFGGSRTYHRMACAVEDAGFILKDCIMWLYGCLSEDTEILTKRGWKHLYKTTKYDKIKVYDITNNIFKWETPERWSVYSVNKDTCYRIKSDTTDQIVSKEHRCIVEREGKFVFKQAWELDKVERMPILPQDFYYKKKSNRKLLLKELLRKNKRLAKTIFSKWQRKEKTREGIIGSEQPSLERRSNLFQKKGKLWQVQDKICQMSKRIFGYGSERRLCYGTQVIGSTKTGAMFIKNRGSSPQRPQSRKQQVGKSNAIQEQQTPQTTRSTISTIEYTGKMFCPTVSTGAFVARRNGLVFITGNSGFPKATDISKQLDKGKERKVIGYKKRPEDNSKRTLRAKNNWIKGGTDITQQPITEPATSEAKLWNGWKSHGLKPAYEPIIVAMKPNDGTYANNALKHGVAGLNIDGGRIPCNDKPKFPEGKYDQNTDIKWRTDKRNKDTQPQGRFPANIILEQSYIPLLTLKGSCDKIKAQVIKQYYENYKVPTMWERVQNISEQDGEVLLSEMLQQVSKRKSTEANVRKETQQGSIKKDESAEREKQEIQGVVLQQGIQEYKSGRVKSKGIKNSKTDDKQKGDIRTQIDNGNEFRQTSKKKRDSSSQERNKRRQQDKELGDNEQYKPHSTSSQANSRKQEIEVLIGDVPKAWLRYFRPTGYSIIDPNSSAKMLDEQSGEIKTKVGLKLKEDKGFIFGNRKGAKYESQKGLHTTISGASRFFYVAKASKSERNMGCEELEEKKVSDGREKEADNAYQRGKTLRSNTHPTVKPLKLMEYLCKLTSTPTGGIVLDPFAGSGTTCMACKKTGRPFIGIEQDKEYCKIAEARIKATQIDNKLF